MTKTSADMTSNQAGPSTKRNEGEVGRRSTLKLGLIDDGRLSRAASKVANRALRKALGCFTDLANDGGTEAAKAPKPVRLSGPPASEPANRSPEQAAKRSRDEQESEICEEQPPDAIPTSEDKASRQGSVIGEENAQSGLEKTSRPGSLTEGGRIPSGDVSSSRPGSIGGGQSSPTGNASRPGSLNGGQAGDTSSSRAGSMTGNERSIPTDKTSRPGSLSEDKTSRPGSLSEDKTSRPGSLSGDKSSSRPGSLTGDKTTSALGAGSRAGSLTGDKTPTPGEGSRPGSLTGDTIPTSGAGSRVGSLTGDKIPTSAGGSRPGSLTADDDAPSGAVSSRPGSLTREENLPAGANASRPGSEDKNGSPRGSRPGSLVKDDDIPNGTKSGSKPGSLIEGEDLPQLNVGLDGINDEPVLRIIELDGNEGGESAPTTSPDILGLLPPGLGDMGESSTHVIVPVHPFPEESEARLKESPSFAARHTIPIESAMPGGLEIHRNQAASHMRIIHVKPEVGADGLPLPTSSISAFQLVQDERNGENNVQTQGGDIPPIPDHMGHLPPGHTGAGPPGRQDGEFESMIDEIAAAVAAQALTPSSFEFLEELRRKITSVAATATGLSGLISTPERAPTPGNNQQPSSQPCTRTSRGCGRPVPPEVREHILRVLSEIREQLDSVKRQLREPGLYK